MKKYQHNKKGFTLVELIVALSVFMVVMTISMGSILSIFNANRKSQNLRSALDNLNLTLESMTRTIRFGENYHCDIGQIPVASPRSCGGGATSMAVFSGGSTVSWRLSANCYGTNSCIERDSGAGWTKLTSSDMHITRLTFYVAGAEPYSTNDLYQPRVVLVVGGYVGSKPGSQTSFNLQTTVSQRNIDSQ